MLLEWPIATFQTLKRNMNIINAGTGHFIRIQVYVKTLLLLRFLLWMLMRIKVASVSSRVRSALYSTVSPMQQVTLREREREIER